MFIEGFVESFANAVGLEDHVSEFCGDDFGNTFGLGDHVSKLCGDELRVRNGPEDIVVAALVSPIDISVEKDPYFGIRSSEEDCNENSSEEDCNDST